MGTVHAKADAVSVRATAVLTLFLLAITGCVPVANLYRDPTVTLDGRPVGAGSVSQCDPCRLWFPVGCMEGDTNCREVSNHPQIAAGYHVFSTIHGAVIHWRPAGESAWREGPTIPVVPYTLDGHALELYTGIRLCEGRDRGVRYAPLVLTRYFDFPAGELYEFSVRAYNDAGHSPPPEQPCQQEWNWCDGAPGEDRDCYLTICWPWIWHVDLEPYPAWSECWS